ncbi:MAG: sigma-54 dependent transcriptional regulator [Gammaproteobacteria bacterium]|nr:sigma-54 dependent transcriptional regulator [Gammaproteobacteria bacterium]
MNGRPEVLFVDDDPRAGELVARFCADGPFDVRVYRDPGALLERFREHGAACVISDLRMPGMDGLALLRAVRELDGEVPVLLVTAYSTVDSAVEALRLGASDFLKKPYDMEELARLVERTLEHRRLLGENRLLRRELDAEKRVRSMVGTSAALDVVRARIARIAAVRSHVVIQGESGTGKELAARAIHDLGPDGTRPFVVIDCGALNDALLESELFGHERGAFTGAVGSKRGLLETATGGTVFLDEIGNVSAAMQTRLLRVIQEQQLTRVGGVHPIGIDVRFIAASNRDLATLVAEGGFREDLYHRLNVLDLRMPPLRERPEDIPLLVRHFLDAFNRQHGTRLEPFDEDDTAALQARDWPGNVRELRNVIERAAALADGPRLRLEPESPRGGREPPGLTEDWPTLAELEARYIERVLAACDGNKAQAAKRLGIDKTTLWRRLKKAGQ